MLRGVSAARPTRPPLPVRIAAWRRRIVVGSLGVFVAAWLAVAALGKQSTTSAATPTTTRAQPSDTSAQSGATQSDPTQTGSAQAGSAPSSSSPDDLSSATTSQS
jgi:hypothetical protein